MNLLQAALSGDLVSVKMYVNKGQINLIDHRNKNALYLSLMSDCDPQIKLSIIKILLEAGANPFYENIDGDSPFLLASRANQTELINLFKLYNSENRKTPTRDEIMHAIMSYDQELSKKLVSERLLKYHNPNAALHFALTNNIQNATNTSLIEYLLNMGANPNQVDAAGDSLLHLAAINNYTPAIKLLHFHGADTTKVNAYGTTSLQLAVIKNNISAVDVILNDLAHSQFDKNISLTHAIWRGQTKIANLIEKKGGKSFVDAIIKQAFPPSLFFS